MKNNFFMLCLLALLCNASYAKEGGAPECVYFDAEEIAAPNWVCEAEGLLGFSGRSYSSAITFALAEASKRRGTKVKSTKESDKNGATINTKIYLKSGTTIKGVSISTDDFLLKDSADKTVYAKFNTKIQFQRSGCKVEVNVEARGSGETEIASESYSTSLPNTQDRLETVKTCGVDRLVDELTRDGCKVIKSKSPGGLFLVHLLFCE